MIPLFYKEDHHAGRPHFHAEFAGRRVSYDIETLKPMGGRLPRRANRLVTEWASLHRDELRGNWRRAREGKPLMSIDPLP